MALKLTNKYNLKHIWKTIRLDNGKYEFESIRKCSERSSIVIVIFYIMGYDKKNPCLFRVQFSDPVGLDTALCKHRYETHVYAIFLLFVLYNLLNFIWKIIFIYYYILICYFFLHNIILIFFNELYVSRFKIEYVTLKSDGVRRKLLICITECFFFFLLNWLYLYNYKKYYLFLDFHDLYLHSHLFNVITLLLLCR